MASRRILFAISAKDKLMLEEYCNVHKISLAAAIGRGIKELKKSQRKQTYKKLVESTCGLWSGKNGFEYQREIRSEWD